MKIFSKKPANTYAKSYKFTGAHLPLTLHTYLTLFSLAEGIPKSSVIVNNLEKWKKATEKNISLDELIERLAEKAVNVWNTQYGYTGIEKYLDNLKGELLDKGIDPKIATQIVKKVKNETHAQS